MEDLRLASIKHYSSKKTRIAQNISQHHFSVCAQSQHKKRKIMFSKSPMKLCDENPNMK